MSPRVKLRGSDAPFSSCPSGVIYFWPQPVANIAALLLSVGCHANLKHMEYSQWLKGAAE